MFYTTLAISCRLEFHFHPHNSIRCLPRLKASSKTGPGRWELDFSDPWGVSPGWTELAVGTQTGQPRTDVSLGNRPNEFEFLERHLNIHFMLAPNFVLPASVSLSTLLCSWGFVFSSLPGKLLLLSSHCCPSRGCH